MSKKKQLSSEERKQHPMYEALFKYFPDALMAVSNHSWKANEKHNPGQPVHWDRSKSTDELDAMLRHVIDKAKGETFCSDGLRHSVSIAWRGLANLQRELESESAINNSVETFNNFNKLLEEDETVVETIRRVHKVFDKPLLQPGYTEAQGEDIIKMNLIDNK